MKILVIGASGRVGSKLTKKLLDNGYEIIGTTRDNDKLFDDKNYSQISLNLKDELKEMIDNFPNGIDAVYFVSGSRGKDLLQVDLHGAIKSMKAAEQKGVERYVMLSTIFATNTKKWKDFLSEDMCDYYIAKHYADDWLINNSKLNYTILQPSTLKEEIGKGKIEVNIDSVGENPIADVAETLIEVLENKAAYNKVITMHSGDTPIKEAITNLE